MDRREFLAKFMPKTKPLQSGIPNENFGIPSENSGIPNAGIPNENSGIRAKPRIDIKACIAWNDVVCNNCADVCHARAIEFLGLFRPQINERCDGCNDCITSCFKGAINVF